MQPPTTLLANGDIEAGSGAPEGWTSSGPDPGQLAFEWASQDGGGGTRSLSIRSADGAAVSTFGYWAQTIPVADPSGAMYELTAQIRTDGVAGPGVAIALRGDVESAGSGPAEAFATTQGVRLIRGSRSWRRISVGLTGIPPEVDRITVYLLYLPETTGTVFFDNVALVTVEETSTTARNYLNGVLDIMQANSIKRYEIEWSTFRSQTLADAAGAQTTADTYGAIRQAIRRIGDNHSFLRPPPPVASVPAREISPPLGAAPTQPSNDGSTPALASPRAELLGDRIGYVEVPAYNGGSPQANDDLATEYHRLIEGVDALGTCGWVVDLRGNTGGNMWPMVAGVGPILGEGTVGQFVDPDSVILSWFYRDGSSGIEQNTITSARSPYSVDPLPPVAVLTDSMTASSGEATAIAFRGRPDARSFGGSTRGLSTANSGYPLGDGATLFLTVATMADRTGQVYGAELQPDELVGGPKTGDPASDLPLRAAMEWLQAQPACAGAG